MAIYKKNVVNFGSSLTGKFAGMKDRFKTESLREFGDKEFLDKRVGLAIDTYLLIVMNILAGNTERKIICTPCGGKVLAEDYICGKLCSVALCDGSERILMADISESGAYLAPSEGHRGTLLQAAILSWHYVNDKEVARLVDDIMKEPINDLEADEWDDELAKEILMRKLCYVTNCLYYYAKDKFVTAQVEVYQLHSEAVAPFLDSPPLFGKKEEKKRRTGSEEILRVERGKYALDPERKLSPLEESMVPKMPDTFVSEPVIETICKDIVNSSAFEQPFRNVLLYGDSGGGKTSIAKAIASYLGLPYAKVTFSPDTDKIEIVGSILPNTEKTNPDEICEKLGIPTFEDVEFDYEGSFEKLFGRKPGKVDDRNDCYKKITEMMMQGVSQAEDFVFVPSNIVQGAENGWVVEIQEAALLKRESELCTINALLENVPGTSITLPTGKEIFRHKDSVFIFTTNMDYKGCKSLQQSVLSRCNIKREIKTPTAETMAKRALAQLKTPKEFEAPTFKRALVNKMAKVCKEIGAYAKDHDITDGVCGSRELNDWCKKALLIAKGDLESEVSERHVVYAAWTTILEKVSQVPEEMEEIVTAVFQKQFTQEDVETGRELYLAGEL